MMKSVGSHRDSRNQALKICLLGVFMACLLVLNACGASTSSSSSSSSSSAADDDSPYKLVSGNTLTVATFADYEPMEYKEGGGINGFDVALINEIGKRLDLTVSIHDEYADSLLAQVAIGDEYDCAISSILIDDSRAQGIAFTDPYLDSSLCIIVPADSKAVTVEDVSKLSVGAVRGSYAEAWANANLPNASYTPFQISEDLFGALDAGTMSAAIYDGPGVSVLLDERKAKYKILSVIPTGKQYGIVVSADNPGLLEAINGALAEMETDGTMAKLKSEWLGEKTDPASGAQSSESTQ